MSKNFTQWAVWSGIGALVLAMGSVAGYRHWEVKKAMAQVDEYTKRGFTALAVETMEKYRERIAATPDGCKLLYQGYLNAQRADRAEWAAEYCMETGKEAPEAYLGFAAAREMMGKDQDALEVLSAGAKKYERNPYFYVSASKILKKLKRDQESENALFKAAEMAPENVQIQVDAMVVVAGKREWKQALPYVQRLSKTKIENPDLILFMSRILKEGGDLASSEQFKAVAVQQLDQIAKAGNPKLKQDLEQAYSDLFVPAGAQGNRRTASVPKPKKK